MTDLEKFIELYRSFGIECKVYEEDGFQVIDLKKAADFHRDTYNATVSEKFKGDDYFYSNVLFDMQGNFVQQGFWE